MVPPSAPNSQVLPRDTDAIEAVLREHTLGREIVHTSWRLEPVQLQFRPSELDRVCNRIGSEPSPAAGSINPIADRCGLRRRSHDLLKDNRADNATVVDYREAEPKAAARCVQRLLKTRLLAGRREEAVVAIRFERRQEVTVAGVDVG